MSSPKIKNRFTDKVIVVAGKYSNIKELVEKEKANLYGANLKGANLKGAYLEGANLEGAYLEGANLEGANLKGANLEGANLEGANLEGANLYGANLEGANLYGAYLKGAYLKGAYLEGAYLEGANLEGANLYGAKNLKLPPFQIIPQEGSFIAWKKTATHLAKIVIPNDAKRTSCIKNRKCRAEYVLTIALFELDGKTANKDAIAIGCHDPKTKYKVGEITRADSFDPNVLEDCSHGIHFFVTREEAEAWHC